MKDMKDYPSFGCCSFWQQCQLGKGVCVYADKQPQKMQACSAYSRGQSIDVTTNVTEIEPVVPAEIAAHVPLSACEREYFERADGQLKLF
jgi:hypothetical protein